MAEKFVGYVRVSTLTQVEGHSLDFQKEAIERYCKANGFGLDKFYIDEGVSGAKYRPEFEKVMKRITEDKEIKGIVVYDFFRFGRSVDDLRHNVYKVDEAGKRFVSIKENIDISTKFGRLMLTLLAGIAEFERETIMERMQAGKEWAKVHGTKSGKPMCRPKKIIDMELVKDRRLHGYSFNKISKEVRVSLPTLMKRAKIEGIL
jgi:DNA invertase Pin-like site-specific DNA recombinase